MATRENQGLQIALVIFVVLTVILGVTNYLFFQKAEEQKDKVIAADKGETVANDKADKANEISLKLRTLVGKHSLDEISSTELSKVESMFLKQMAFYGINWMGGEEAGGIKPDDIHGYDTLCKYLNNLLNNKENKILELNAQLAQSNKATQAEKIAKEALSADYADKLKIVKDEYTKKVDDNAGLLAALQEGFKKIENDVDIQVKKYDTNKNAADAEKKDLKNKNDDLHDINKTLVKERERRNRINFDNPHGKVIWVNQRDRLVYINLGSSDFLKPQITFSVYDTDENNFTTAKPKGKIEVMRISGSHTAVCRMLNPKIKNPVMSGDRIFSAIWQPGQKLHFAIAGFMDINGDKQSDRAKVKSLIHLNGGIIDCELKDNGELVGSVTARTRYFVRGEPISTKKEFIDNFGIITRDVKRTGTTIISIQQFIDMMGYVPDERTVPLGKGADPSQFPPTRIKRDSTGNLFRPRTPPGSIGKD